jgi:hypothetical protein
LEVSLEDGDYIPEPAPVEIVEHSGKFVLRLPTSLHMQLSRRAEQEKTSLNQLLLMLISESMGRWTARTDFGTPRFDARSLVEAPVDESTPD